MATLEVGYNRFSTGFCRYTLEYDAATSQPTGLIVDNQSGSDRFATVQDPKTLTNYTGTFPPNAPGSPTRLAIPRTAFTLVFDANGFIANGPNWSFS